MSFDNQRQYSTKLDSAKGAILIYIVEKFWYDIDTEFSP